MKTNFSFLPNQGGIICSLLIVFIGFSAFTAFVADPVARLGTLSGGNITAEDFKKHEGLNAVSDKKDKIIECTITGFNMVWVAKQKDPVEVIHRNTNFNDKSKKLVESAKTGDIFYFDEVKARCPGDEEDRKINSLVFKIK